MLARTSNSFIAGWLLAAVILPALAATHAQAQWGDFTVHFQAEGKPDRPIVIPGKPGLPAKLPDESFVVDKNGNLANVVVWLMTNDAKLATHPAYEMAAKDKVIVSTLGGRFVPHVTLIRAGQTLVLTNGDMVGYNANYHLSKNRVGGSALLAPGETHTVPDLTASEQRPAPLSCSIHPWMNGWILVQSHPYMAASAADGTLTIKDLPAGKHTFQFWQENVGYVPSNGKLKTVKGKAEIEIEDGKATDLGTVLVKYKTK